MRTISSLLLQRRGRVRSKCKQTPKIPQYQLTIHIKTTLARYTKTTLIDTGKKYQFLKCAERARKKETRNRNKKQRFARSLNTVNKWNTEGCWQQKQNRTRTRKKETTLCGKPPTQSHTVNTHNPVPLVCAKKRKSKEARKKVNLISSLIIKRRKRI